MMDLHRERRCAESIARLAGRHIRRELTKNVDVSLKAPHDLVTNVDRSTERLVAARLKEVFPDDGISGEEYGTSSESADDASTRRWLIDPIDGTLNFTHGIPIFCVSIALEIDGRIAVAAIYDPNLDELFSAARGEGTHLDGQPVSVSDIDELETSCLVTGFPLTETESFEWTMKQFDLLTRNCRGIRRLGSAALDLAYLAAGRLEAFWEYGLKPWDTAAGLLLVEEAGGRVTDVNGGEFSIDDPSIAASNGAIHDELLEHLQSVL